MFKQITLALSFIIGITACGLERKIDATNISLSPLFSSGMILPTNSQTSIWGKATAGSTVAVRISEYVKLCRTDEDGNWVATFPKIILDKPFSIQIEGMDTLINLTNIRAGKIVVIAGDANLIHAQSLNFENCYTRDSKSTFAYRVYRPEELYSGNVKNKFSGGRWYPADEAGKLLRTCKAIEVLKEICVENEVPLGIIDLTCPGSSLVNWLPSKASSISLQSDFSNYKADSVARIIISMNDTCRKGIDVGAVRTWFKDELWPETELPFSVANRSDFPNKRITYLRKKIYIPPKYMESDFIIEPGVVHGEAEYYFNQQKIEARKSKNGTLQLHIPDSLLKIWTNMLAIRLFSQDDKAGIYGNDFVIFNTDTTFRLGIRENWRFNTELEASFPEIQNSRETPALCYNACIAPLRKLKSELFVFYSSNLLFKEELEDRFVSCELSGIASNSESKILVSPEITTADTLIYGLNEKLLGSKYALLRDSCEWQLRVIKN